MNNILKLFIMLLLSPTFCYATIIELDLNDFSSLDAVISLDGKSALLSENNFTRQIILENSPFLGDSNIIVPKINRILSFDYTFIEGLNDDDSFSVYLFDDTLGSFFGLLKSFTWDSSSSGTIEFDLSSYVGLTLGLSFELYDNDIFNINIMSTVSISQLMLRPPLQTTIPEPNILPLLLMALALMRFNKKHV